MTVNKLLKYEDIVLPILETDIKARNDDFHLYAEVIRALCPQYSDIELRTALECHNEMHLPNYESVTRVRRKLQREYPELESERTRKRRLKEQEVYKEYAKSC